MFDLTQDQVALASLFVGIVAVGFAAVGLPMLYWKYRDRVEKKLADDRQYAEMIGAALQQSTLNNAYYGGLDRGLGLLDRWMGERHEWGRGFLWCLRLSILYASGMLLLGWAITGQATSFGELSLLPDGSSIPDIARWALVLLLFAGWAAAFLIVANQETANVGMLERLGRYGSPTILAVFLGGAFAFALAGVFAVAVAVAVAGAGAVIVAVAVVFALATGLLGLFQIIDPAEAYSILLFIMVLPFLNAILDWASWWISRWFGEDLVHSEDADAGERAKGFAIHLIGDFLAALGLLVVLAFALSHVVEASIWLYSGVIDFGEAAWPVYMCSAAREPLGAGLWATMMLFSTLVPSLLHFAGLILVVFVWLLGVHSEAWRDRGSYLLGGPVPAVDLPSIALTEADQIAIDERRYPTTLGKVAARHVRFRLIYYPLALLAASGLIYVIIVGVGALLKPLPWLLLLVASLDLDFVNQCLG